MSLLVKNRYFWVITNSRAELLAQGVAFVMSIANPQVSTPPHPALKNISLKSKPHNFFSLN